MNEDIAILTRRTFVKFTSAAVAGFATGSAQSTEKASEPPLTTRSQPSDPIVLKSAELELALDRHDGLPYEYRVTRSNRRMLGESLGRPIEATYCSKRSGEFKTIPVSVQKAIPAASQADFTFTVVDGSGSAVAFALTYSVEAGAVKITLHDVRESEGYELIEVAMPRLATVREEDGQAWLAHGDEGGNLALLKDATPASLKPNTFWGNVLATLPVVMIGTDRVLCVQETTAFMDSTTLTVVGDPGMRRASIGTTKTHRVSGSPCYDMNTGPGTPRNCGDKQTPNLLVEQESSCRLDFMSATGDQPALTWLDGAKLVRARMPAIPSHLYDNCFVYGIRCDEPSFPKPASTFAQCEQLIRQIAELTDYTPQIAHLWGWQYRGKDTGYPAVQEVNQRIGGYDGMMSLMQKARDYNCIATLSDNYDDAYRSSPAWDEKIIARRPDGQLWESRNWTGENSYIIGLAKYMAGPGLERVRYTCERYKLPKTTHVDVLSYFSIRNDWDRENPASGIKNLSARYRVLEDFAKRGVDVSSEALRYAFIGKISAFWYMTGPAPCPFGGQPIPLLATIYRKSAVWGQSGRTTGIADRVLKTLFYNGCSHAMVRADIDLNDVLDTFYLVMVPWFVLHARNIEYFRRQDQRTSIGLEGGYMIDIDWASKSYSVSIVEYRLATDTSTSCPLDENRIAFYSLTPKSLSVPLPRDWKPNEIRAAKLSVNGPEDFRATVENGQISVQLEARQPVIVYKNEAARRRRTIAGEL